MLQAIQSADEYIMLFLQDNVRTAVLNAIMIFVTTIGNTGAVWLILGAVMLIPKKHRRSGLTLLACISLCWIFNDLILKNIIARPRPFMTIESLTLLVGEPSSWSFPSGHSCSSFASAYALTKCFGKKGAWSYVLAALIALSRPYVGVHYVSDIIVGAIVGTIGAILVCITLDKLSAKRTSE